MKPKVTVIMERNYIVKTLLFIFSDYLYIMQCEKQENDSEGQNFYSTSARKEL